MPGIGDLDEPCARERGRDGAARVEREAIARADDHERRDPQLGHERREHGGARLYRDDATKDVRHGMRRVLEEAAPHERRALRVEPGRRPPDELGARRIEPVLLDPRREALGDRRIASRSLCTGGKRREDERARSLGVRETEAQSDARAHREPTDDRGRGACPVEHAAEVVDERRRRVRARVGGRLAPCVSARIEADDLPPRPERPRLRAEVPRAPPEPVAEHEERTAALRLDVQTRRAHAVPRRARGPGRHGSDTPGGTNRCGTDDRTPTFSRRRTPHRMANAPV